MAKDFNQATNNLSSLWKYDKEFFENHESSLLLKTILADNPKMPLLEGIVLMAGLVNVSICDLYKWVQEHKDKYECNYSFGEKVKYEYNPETDPFIYNYRMNSFMIQLEKLANADINAELTMLNDAIKIRNERRRKKKKAGKKFYPTPLMALIDEDRITYVRSVTKEILDEYNQISQK